MNRPKALGVLFAFGIAPTLAIAQLGTSLPRLGLVTVNLGAKCSASDRDDAFLQRLSELGHVPGQNIVVDLRCYVASDELGRVLKDLVRLKTNVIFVTGPEAALAARKATKDIPVVCGSCGDPVEAGLVTNLGRPGGNVTGFASLSAELIGKRVQLLREAVPGLSRLAVLIFPSNPGTRPTVQAILAAGRTLGVEIGQFEIRSTGDLEKAFQSAATNRFGAVLVQDDPRVVAARIQLANLALQYHLPSIAGLPTNADAGTLIAYGPDRVDLFKRSAGLVDKILKGAKPGDIAFEQPTKFDLVINAKTAKILRIVIPPSLLLRADRVIE